MMAKKYVFTEPPTAAKIIEQKPPMYRLYFKWSETIPTDEQFEKMNIPHKVNALYGCQIPNDKNIKKKLMTHWWKLHPEFAKYIREKYKYIHVGDVDVEDVWSKIQVADALMHDNIEVANDEDILEFSSYLNLGEFMFAKTVK